MADFAPEAHDDYAPHPVQLEFIRLAAEKYWYLAFGDTDHGRPELRSFAVNTRTVDALERAGKKHYFLETNPADQYYYDYLRREENRGGVTVIDIGKVSQGRRDFGGMWLDEKVNDRLVTVFEKAARDHKGVHFIAADKRLESGDEYRGLLRRLNRAALRGKAWELTLDACHRITGRYGHRAHSLAKIFAENPEKMMARIGCQDRKTFSGMQSFSGPAALFFGAGHFDTCLDDAQSPHILGSLLPGDGKSLCVFKLYRDQAHREEEEKEKELLPEAEYGQTVTPPDAELYVDPPPGLPYGIKINNPDLLPLYEQALANAQAGQTFQSVTTQPLPS